MKFHIAVLAGDLGWLGPIEVIRESETQAILFARDYFASTSDFDMDREPYHIAIASVDVGSPKSSFNLTVE